jgi:hypothetical protein
MELQLPGDLAALGRRKEKHFTIGDNFSAADDFDFPLWNQRLRRPHPLSTLLCGRLPILLSPLR